MTRSPRPPLLHRDLRAAEYLDLFMVAAVTTVLSIRFGLAVAGYPQVGGAGLHIAHMLWGGLLMAAALVLLLAFLGRRSRLWAALVGGVGFGTFIDEIGKFVTRDNDYFYRPAVALIYLVLVMVYLAGRSVSRRATVTRQEYLVNALQEMEQAVINDLQADEQERALEYLARSGARDAFAAGLASLLVEAELAPTGRPGPLRRLHRAALERYRRLAAHHAFERALVAFFTAQVVVKLVTVAAVVARPDAPVPVVANLALMTWNVDGVSVAEWLQIASSLVSALLVALGVATMRRSRERALRLFHRSILVSIFLTQVFMFYRDQWAALLVLAFNLLVLAALNFMREHDPETVRRKRA